MKAAVASVTLDVPFTARACMGERMYQICRSRDIFSHFTYINVIATILRLLREFQ
jgi:hypothetical protein